MEKYSLKARIIFITLIISMIVPLVSYFVIHRNNQTARIYQNIANETLNRVDTSGEMLSNFRQIRVEVRSLGLIDNSKADAEKYITDTVKAIGEFENSKSKLEKLLVTKEEKAKFDLMDQEWQKFYEFGKGLLLLAKQGDPESIRKLAHEVRVNCPIKKESVEKHIREFIEVEKAVSIALVTQAKASASDTSVYAVVGTIIGALGAIIIGFIFASSISKSLEGSIHSMLNAVEQLNGKSSETSDVSDKISDSSVQQASSLQETVASIDEISAMVSRNADSASSAAMSTEDTIRSVHDGKKKVEEMRESINAIAEGNDEVIRQMNNSNKEISDIVLVIQEISQKTQVINDIVFQTKLLSFNASVEAARAGEHGKGFAVVAEEVGNLASMSGKAANEISALLTKSVSRVSEIVEGSKTIMNRVVEQSKSKVNNGTKIANDCAFALDEISHKISSMSEMVKEISVASHEQSTGIREVNKAMSHLDHMTQSNSQVAQRASMTASDLKLEADKIGKIVGELTSLVRGQSYNRVSVLPANVTRMTPKKRQIPSADDLKFG